jgi:ferredoxin-NADP reductase
MLDRQIDFWMQEVSPAWSLGALRARVVDVIDETHDVRTFVLAPNAHWPGHRAGQFVTVEVEIEGVRVQRCYSLSSAPGRRHIAISDSPTRSPASSRGLSSSSEHALSPGKPHGS